MKKQTPKKNSNIPFECYHCNNHLSYKKLFNYNKEWFYKWLLRENKTLNNKKIQNVFLKDVRKEPTSKKDDHEDEYLKVFLKDGLLFKRLTEFRLEEKLENLDQEIGEKKEHYKSLQAKYSNLKKKYKELKSLSFLRENKKDYWDSYIEKHEDVLKKYLVKNREESHSRLNKIKKHITSYKKEWEKLEANIKQKENKIEKCELLREKIENSINDLKKDLETIDVDKKCDNHHK